MLSSAALANDQACTRRGRGRSCLAERRLLVPVMASGSGWAGATPFTSVGKAVVTDTVYGGASWGQVLSGGSGGSGGSKNPP